MTSDAELLRRYALERAEPAFEEFVRRNLPMVYSAALRTLAGDTHAAEDVTQVVFCTTATLSLPLANGRLIDSKLSDIYPNADISQGSIRRDSLFLGFEGDDVFYQTTQLKNGWKVVGIDLVIKGEHYAGASITESGVGSERLYAKVSWYIITSFPSFELDLIDYTLVWRLSGPVGQPFF